MRSPAHQGAQVKPGAAFLVVVLAFGAGALLTVIDTGLGPRVGVFVFVLAGWTLSLIFHEFAHAYMAWRGGDSSIPSKGYLTLDPRRYADPVTSIGLPILIVILGGIGLPGGAVWINTSALRSKTVASLVSLAGPVTNLGLAALFLLPVSAGVVNQTDHFHLTAALTFLGFLQVVAFVLNIMPIPGLDGYGAIEPFLPDEIRQLLAPVRRWAFLIVVGLYFYVPPVGDAFWDLILFVMGATGVDLDLVRDGFNLFRFWR